MQSESEPTVVRLDHPHIRGITTIRFNRPHVKNALGPDDLLLANRHLLDCQHDSTVSAIFVTGTGDAFCSGFDLKVLNALAPENRGNALETATEFLMRIVTTPKIVICALNGASAGLGNHIAICSDLCVARRDAALHFTGATKGIPSMQFGALILPMTIGMKRAKSLLLRGGKVSAARAEELGICNEVIEPTDWDTALDNLAREFSERNTAVLAQNKFQMNQNAFQMIGALKMSGLAGNSHMASAGELSTGRVKNEVSR